MEKVPLSHYAKLLASHLMPYWPRVVALMACMLAGIGLSVVNPLIMGFFIDTAIPQAADAAPIDAAEEDSITRYLILAASAFLIIGVVRQGIQLVSTWLSQDVGWRATNRMRADLARHCLNLDMWFHHERTPGEMVERVDGDATTLSNFFSEFVVQIFGNAIFLIVVLVIVAFKDPRVGLGLTIFSIVALLVYNATRSVAVPIYTAEREGYARLFGFLEERALGIEDIRTNGAVDYTMDRFYEANNDTYNRVLRSEFMGEILRSISGVLFAVGHALAMVMGYWLYREGTFTLGTVFILFRYTSMLRRPLRDISRQINDLQRATAGMRRIEQFFETKSLIADGDRELPPSGALTVEFDHLTFAYVEGEPVLKDVSFELGAGRVLGLLGRTGSGKTTITRLIFRLYDPQLGEIRIGGTELKKLRLDNLRQRVGMVTQDVQVFRATVRENLALFRSDVKDEDILAALDRLGLTDWFETLENGLDTEITSDGLSAGEAQLLAFGRAFLQDPSVVILDEPSSRLDPATERRIDRAITALLEGRTGIIIAHRLGTVQRVDEIMILTDGRIEEHGSRSDLANDPNSRFADLLRTGLEEGMA